MTRDELTGALDGLFAYDGGAVDSGVHDEGLRARCVEALAALPLGPYELYSPELSRLVRDMWLSDEAIDAGYGLETAVEFVRWLGDRMGCAELL